jgi:glycosyltransferase involved in cell wall biosynthesis
MRILFLSTWFPYPPYQGSKIRAFHLLKALASKHDVALVSFEDADLQPEWKEYIGQFCPVIETLPRKPFAASRVKTWLGWLSPQPSAVVAIHSPEMGELVRQVAGEWQPDCVVALTFVTAPYALEIAGVPKVLDIDNVMARMLFETIPMAAGLPDRFRRWLAYLKFARYEKRIYPQFDRCLVVTESDREGVRRWVPLTPEQVWVVSNGVDITFLQPGMAKPAPKTLVFNGALSYNANYDAMDYFLREIFPIVLREVPEARLKITGSTAGVDLTRLALNGSVQFTGYLEDIRPTVAGSWACVVPLRLGGGTRLKILEAMALGTPVVSTFKGAEGLEVKDGQHLLLADTAETFAAQVVRLLNSAGLREDLARNGSQLAAQRYDWSQIEQHFNACVESLILGS